MHVVVYDPTQSEGVRLHRLLLARGVPVDVTHDAQRVVALIEQHDSDLVLLCTQGFSVEPLALAEQLRVKHVCEPSEIQLVCGPLDDSDVAHVFDSGIDAIIPWGTSEEALLSRVAAVARVLERVERKANAPAFNVDRDAGAQFPLRLIYRSTAWRQAPQTMRDVVARFFSHAANPMPLAPHDAQGFDEAAANVMYSDVHGVQIRIAAAADSASAHMLAGKFVGAHPEGLVDDMLVELANVLTGALKNKFSLELLSFTSGLSMSLPSDAVGRSTTTFVYRHLMAFEIGHARLALELGMAAKAVAAVEVQALRDGMIIAHDLIGARGDLLLKRGTRLSSQLALKLSERLPPRMRVQIMSS